MNSEWIGRFKKRVQSEILVSMATVFQRSKRCRRIIEKMYRKQTSMKKQQRSTAWIDDAFPQYVHSFLAGFMKLPSKTKRSLACSFSDGYLNHIKKRAPIAVVIDVTYACNLNCYGCFSSDMKKKEEINPQMLSHLLDQLYTIGNRLIVISGGEPLCYAPLLDIISNYREMFFYVFTNGTLVSDEVIVRAKSLDNLFFFVSVDGDKENIEKRRGKGVYEKLNQTIDQFSRERIPYGISITVSDTNRHIVNSDRFIDEYVQRGVAMIFFLQMSVISCNDKEFVKQQDYKDFSLILEKRRLHGLETACINLPWDEAKFSKEGCIAGTHILHIDLYGGVRICPFSRQSVFNINDFECLEDMISALLSLRDKSHCINERNASVAIEIPDHPV